MRLWKAGAAAAMVIGAAAALQVSGANAHGQVIQEQDIREPIERAMQVLTLGGGSRIGVSIADVSAADVEAKKLPGESGVLVREVETDGAAAKAGLQAGDVIVEFDGERVRSESQLRRLIQETPAGRSVAVAVWRDGRRLTFTIQSESRRTSVTVTPRVHVAPRPPRPPRPPAPPQVFRMPGERIAPRVEIFRDGFAYSLGGSRLGAAVQTLNAQLATHFGVERGVLVTEVTEDSPAAKAGLRSGDVITRMNSRAIENSGDLLREISSASGEVAIEIVRDGKPQTVKATLEPARTWRWGI